MIDKNQTSSVENQWVLERKKKQVKLKWIRLQSKQASTWDMEKAFILPEQDRE